MLHSPLHCYGRPAAASRPGQRTIRPRSVLPHRAARHGIHRGGARGARPPRHARRSPLQRVRSQHCCARRGRRWSASPRCTRSRPTKCSRWPPTSAALSPDVPIVVGGHTAAAYPAPFLAAGRRRGRARRWRARDAGGRATRSSAARRWARCRDSRCATATAASSGPPARPATLRARRGAAAGAASRRPWRRQYACLAHRPTWLIETARGCPFRCSFCSIWQLHARAVRERSIESVCRDFASVGDHVFVADDLFWHHPSRSLELARELRRRGVRKRWILVQSRADLVARHRSCSRRGGRWRRTSTSSSGSRRRPTKA